MSGKLEVHDVQMHLRWTVELVCRDFSVIRVNITCPLIVKVLNHVINWKSFSMLIAHCHSNIHQCYFRSFCMKYTAFVTGAKLYLHVSLSVEINAFSSISIYMYFIWATAWQNQPNDFCARQRLRSAWASAQSDQSSLCAFLSSYQIC